MLMEAFQTKKWRNIGPGSQSEVEYVAEWADDIDNFVAPKQLKFGGQNKQTGVSKRSPKNATH